MESDAHAHTHMTWQLIEIYRTSEDANLFWFQSIFRWNRPNGI